MVTTILSGEESFTAAADTDPTTLIVGEEDPAPTTLAVGEEDREPTTLSLAEEDDPRSFDSGIVNPFGAF